MNRRQQINKILHDYIDVDKNTDYTNYKKLITAIEEWHEQQVKSVDLADVGGNEVECDHNYPSENGWSIHQPQHCSNCGKDL